MRKGKHFVRDNSLLLAVPRAERERLEAIGERVQLPVRESVYERGQPVRHVYFPFAGVISLVADLADGHSVEVATVGNEGMVGMPAFFGVRSVPGKAFVQLPTEALRIPAEAFSHEARAHTALHTVLHRYAQALFNQISWSLVCMGQHAIEQRCARWLLMTHDRVEDDSFPLTEEFLAQMLSVPRPVVSEAAGRLQTLGLIRYDGATITVLDRMRLESYACECYATVRDEYDRLFG